MQLHNIRHLIYLICVYLVIGIIPVSIQAQQVSFQATDPLAVYNKAGTSLTWKKIPKNKQHWYLVIGGGGLTVNNMDLFSKSKLSYPVGPYAQYIVGGPYLPGPSAGLNIHAAINYEKKLNTHWSWNAGFEYRYLQNNQSILDSLLRTQHLINAAHFLQIPFNLIYCLNSSATYKFSLLLGGSFGWALSEHWQIPIPDMHTLNNNTLLVYVPGTTFYNESLNNRWVAGVHADFRFGDLQKVSFSLVADQTLTPVDKKAAGLPELSYYQHQFSLAVCIPIRFMN